MDVRIPRLEWMSSYGDGGIKKEREPFYVVFVKENNNNNNNNNDYRWWEVMRTYSQFESLNDSLHCNHPIDEIKGCLKDICFPKINKKKAVRIRRKGNNLDSFIKIYDDIRDLLEKYMNNLLMDDLFRFSDEIKVFLNLNDDYVNNVDNNNDVNLDQNDPNKSSLCLFLLPVFEYDLPSQLCKNDGSCFDLNGITDVMSDCFSFLTDLSMNLSEMKMIHHGERYPIEKARAIHLANQSRNNDSTNLTPFFGERAKILLQQQKEKLDVLFCASIFSNRGIVSQYLADHLKGLRAECVAAINWISAVESTLNSEMEGELKHLDSRVTSFENDLNHLLLNSPHVFDSDDDSDSSPRYFNILPSLREEELRRIQRLVDADLRLFSFYPPASSLTKRLRSISNTIKLTFDILQISSGLHQLRQKVESLSSKENTKDTASFLKQLEDVKMRLSEYGMMLDATHDSKGGQKGIVLSQFNALQRQIRSLSLSTQNDQEKKAKVRRQNCETEMSEFS